MSQFVDNRSLFVDEPMSAARYKAPWLAGSQPLESGSGRAQRASLTLTRTPFPSGRLMAEASPPWNSAISRTM